MPDSFDEAMDDGFDLKATGDAPARRFYVLKSFTGADRTS